jgi:hypothetical protein
MSKARAEGQGRRRLGAPALAAAALVSAAALPGAGARPSDADPEEARETLAMVCRPGAGARCPGRCLVPRRGGRVGYCTVECDARACPDGWRCMATQAGRRVCARGPEIQRDLTAQFEGRFPGDRAKLARRWYRWYAEKKGPYQAELMAQIFLVSGLVAIPSPGRHWTTRFLEDVLFFVRLFPDSFQGTKYARLERKPIAGGAGRTVPERGAIEVHDGNFGIYGTFLHEMGHVLDDVRNGGFDVEPEWRRIHGWSRDPSTPSGWRKQGKDCTSGYGTAYGVPGQEFADEQWNFIRYGCSFRQCSPAYYAYLKDKVYGGWCFCSKDPACKNANPFQ